MARMREWTSILGALAAAVALCSCGDGRGGHRAHAYRGHSAHWDQSAVPVSLQCAACHPKEFEEWAGSDHAWAMRKISSKLDGAPFRGQSQQAHGETTRFLARANGAPFLRVESEGAEPAEFDAVFAIGKVPLVQYLVRGNDGGCQVTSAAWDSGERGRDGLRSVDTQNGNQWFDVFRDDARQRSNGMGERAAGEWGHWQGRGMNWDSQCAWCHMSGFHKNYDVRQDQYRAEWKEIGVTCIQCHKLADKPAPDGCLVAPADRKLSPMRAHDNCASCHARREELDDNFTAGDRFDDLFRLELPRVPGVFYPNGIQRDEDYCETGFRLSRMGMRGVTCIECHDAHTGALLHPAENNELCLRCHAEHQKVNGVEAPYVDRGDTFTCPAGTKGHMCVECHMPESTYMGRDPRRDHTLLPPDPRLSLEIGTPNACTMCHAGKDNEWAAKAVERRYGEHSWLEGYRPRFRAVAHAMDGQFNQDEMLAAYAQEENPAWRATMLGLLSQMPRTDAVLQTALKATRDASPMLRAAAAELLGADCPERLLKDSCRSVRHAAVRALLPSVPDDSPAMKEYQETLALQADQPAGAMQLAQLSLVRQDLGEAERQYRRAVELDPASAVPRMDYAVFLDRLNRPVEALQQMLDCAAAHPQDAEVQYRLALILAEVGQREAARHAANKAVQLNPQHEAAAQLLRALQP